MQPRLWCAVGARRSVQIIVMMRAEPTDKKPTHPHSSTRDDDDAHRRDANPPVNEANKHPFMLRRALRTAIEAGASTRPSGIFVRCDRKRVDFGSGASCSSSYATKAGANEDAKAGGEDDVAARLSNAPEPTAGRRSEPPARLTRDRLYYPGQSYDASDLAAPTSSKSRPVRHTAAAKTEKNPMKGKGVEKTLLEKATYEDARFLTTFLSDTGKIYPKRRLGVSAKAQRKISRVIKTARQMGILPYTQRLPQFQRARGNDA